MPFDTLRPAPFLVWLALAAAGGVTPVRAQEPQSAASSIDATAPAESPAPVPVKDIGDLWRHVRHKPLPLNAGAAPQTAQKPFFFVSPSVSSKPSTGLSAGVASSIVFVAGNPATTRISSGDWSGNASVKGQAGTGLRFRIFTPTGGAKKDRAASTSRFARRSDRQGVTWPKRRRSAPIKASENSSRAWVTKAVARIVRRWSS